GSGPRSLIRPSTLAATAPPAAATTAATAATEPTGAHPLAEVLELLNFLGCQAGFREDLRFLFLGRGKELTTLLLGNLCHERRPVAALALSSTSLAFPLGFGGSDSLPGRVGL